MNGVRSTCIVSCSEKKRDVKTSAEDLYRSESFMLSRRYAQSFADRWFVFSGKHGLVRPDELLEPYDQNLADLSEDDRKKLTGRVKRQIKTLNINPKQACTSLCDHLYNQFLEDAGFLLSAKPVENLSSAQKQEWLRSQTDRYSTESDLDATYAVIARLLQIKGLTRLADFFQGDFPSAGVYLFFDEREHRLRSSNSLRMVRVGTHGVAMGSKATLRQRLRTHLGSGAGGGNHRSSIFRLHVGRGLIAAGKVPESPSWGKSEFPTKRAEMELEAELEAKVSKYIGNLLVAVLDVPGESSKFNDRAYLEQNLIAVLSNGYKPLDPSSARWLGNKSDKTEIRKSGIWNVNHTAQTYEKKFLQVLEYYVSFTLGESLGKAKPSISADWEANVRRDIRQPSLF